MTSIVAMNSRYKIDITALCEARLAETGDLTEVGAGYTFHWSGKGKEEAGQAEISLVRKL